MSHATELLILRICADARKVNAEAHAAKTAAAYVWAAGNGEAAFRAIENALADGRRPIYPADDNPLEWGLR